MPNLTQAQEQLQQNLEYQTDTLKVFIADVFPSETLTREEMQDRVDETHSLVTTYGGVVIVDQIQKRGRPDYNTFLWSGKLDEIIFAMREAWAQLLVIGNILKPHQMYEINKRLAPIGAKAWDRVDLILKIFEKNAKTEESRLQIQLASIEHMGPRIFDMGEELGSQWAGWVKGSRWKWETNTEIMKRHLEKRVKMIKKSLEHFAKVRAEHRKSRKNKWLPTIWIVGYTNAWKSSLLNILTKKWVLQEDKLFATLGTSVGEMFIPWVYDDKGEVSAPKTLLLSDTIGFIRDLPPQLIKSFASTLEDSIESDMLLHVVDASDTKMREKTQVVNDILSDIGATQPMVYVFNKIDLLTQEQLKEIKKEYQDILPVYISTYSWEGIEELRKVLQDCV